MNNVLDLTTAHAQALLYNTWLDFYVANATDVDDFDELTAIVGELGFLTRFIVPSDLRIYDVKLAHTLAIEHQTWIQEDWYKYAR